MTIELKVPHMACPKAYRFAYGACAKTITQAIIKLDSKASVKADPKTKQVIVNTKVSESSVKDAIAAAGYPPV
ncbi:MAG: heavy-metal-associated domain-containing protein [Waterburya sp.]